MHLRELYEIKRKEVLEESMGKVATLQRRLMKAIAKRCPSDEDGIPLVGVPFTFKGGECLLEAGYKHRGSWFPIRSTAWFQRMIIVTETHRDGSVGKFTEEGAAFLRKHSIHNQHDELLQALERVRYLRKKYQALEDELVTALEEFERKK